MINAMNILISAITSAAVALLMTLVAHRLTSKRDIFKQQREQRIAYLVSAFRSLSKIHNISRLHGIEDKIEEAISDIQLLGTPCQIELASKFVIDLSTPRTLSVSIDELLNSLRNNLRKELGEKSVKRKLFWVHIKRKEELEDHGASPSS
jgi:hypothetical protein